MVTAILTLFWGEFVLMALLSPARIRQWVRNLIAAFRSADRSQGAKPARVAILVVHAEAAMPFSFIDMKHAQQSDC